MKTLLIPVHSIVDVITNSSSEIFVAANKSTVKAIKKLVNDLINAGQKEPTGDHIPYTVDELFDFEIVFSCTDEGYDEVFLTEKEIKVKKKEIDDLIEKYSNELEKLPDGSSKEREDLTGKIEELETWSFNDDDGEGYPRSQIRVTVKDKTNKSAVAAAKVLSDLTALFEIEATYN
jgi:hypothetical protein